MFFSVEWSIVHNNSCTFFQTWQQALFNPHFEKCWIHFWVVLHRCNYFISNFCSNNICPLKLFTWYFIIYFLPAWCVSIFTIKTFIYSCFVNICDFFFRNIFDFFKILLYFFFILFFITQRLFFRVIPSLLYALLIACGQQPNTSATSSCVSSGCSATYVFSFSGFIFL